MTGHDDQESEPVAVVNESLPKPSGRVIWETTVKFGPPAASGPRVRIVNMITSLVRERQDKPAAPRIYILFDEARTREWQSGKVGLYCEPRAIH